MNILNKVLAGVDRDLLQEDGLDLKARSDQIVILAQVHCLTSMVELFERLRQPDLGIRANRVIIVPKPYSSIESAVQHLRDTGFCIIDQVYQFRPGRYDNAAHKALLKGCVAAFRLCETLAQSGRKVRLVIVDDGGLLTETWWRLADGKNRHKLSTYHLNASVLTNLDVISVQQTASGIMRAPDPGQLTKIDISRSAAKRFFESKIIAKGVLKKVRGLHLLSKVRSVGVIGVGAVGTALAKDLLRRGISLYLYDRNKECNLPSAVNCKSAKHLLRRSEIVFGCTGHNSLRLEYLRNIKVNKPIHFVSCSSRDVEFQSLLHTGTQGKSPFHRVTVEIPDGDKHYIENGGFPINFDRSREQEAPEEITLTRALLFAGIMQAICVKNVRPMVEAIMLSPSAQKHIVSLWMHFTGFKPEQFGVTESDFDSPGWWRENSGGCISAAYKMPETNHGTQRPFVPKLKAAGQSETGNVSWAAALKRQ